MLRARPTSTIGLQTRIAELELSVLFPCDLGDGIEVVHDVEAIEVELDCSLDDTRDDDAEVEIEPGHTDLDLRVALGLHVDGEPESEPDSETDHLDALIAAQVALNVEPQDAHTKPFVRDPDTRQFVRETESTHQFVRESAPYERIEIQLDHAAFLRATIEDAKTTKTMQAVPRRRTHVGLKH